MSRRYFHVAAASELLFEAAITCPAHPGITFDGVAVDHTSAGDQVFVIVSIHDGEATHRSGRLLSSRRAAAVASVCPV